MLLFLSVLIPSLSLAAIAALLWGPAAAEAILAAVGSIAAMTDGLLHIFPPAHLLDKSVIGHSIIVTRIRNSRATAILTSLVLGTLTGSLLGPMLFAYALQPAVSIQVPDPANERQDVWIHWRNVRPTATTCKAGTQPGIISLVVRRTKKTVYYPQACHAPITARAMRCDAEIGGGNDAGAQFELLVELSDQTASNKLEDAASTAGFAYQLPPGLQQLASRTITRK